MDTKTKPKIAVIIPTRERGDVLEKSLQTVTSQDYGNLDIVVSDNFSTDKTEEIVRSANDTRIRYINTGKRLSMSENWEFALANIADDRWVTILGDDDGLLPHSLSWVAEIIRSTDVHAIRTSVCSYRWPSLTGEKFGRLAVPLESAFEMRSSTDWLEKVLSGRNSYTELPMLYNGGFVRMSVLRKIESVTGVIYRSCIPDVYSAVAIASVVNRYIYSHVPTAINGASLHSTGTSQFAKKGSSVTSPAQAFTSEENLPFHEDLPLCRNGHYPKSLQALVYESFLQSMELRSNVHRDRHAEQLEVILATSGSHKSVMDRWGLEFARKHDLDFTQIRAKARRKRVLFSIASIANKARVAMHTYDIGSPQLPIADVYEASLAAAATRANVPSRTERLLQLVKRAARISLKD